MTEQNKAKKMLVIYILAVTAAVIFSIFCLTLIWRPKTDVKINQNDKIGSIDKGKLGTYTSYNIDNSKKVKDYGGWIIDAMARGDYASLYSALNPEYIEYFNLDFSKFKDLMKRKGFMEKPLKINEYVTTKINDNTYTLVHITSTYKGVEGNAVITEYSPNNYKIAFDDFIFYNKVPKKYISDDLEMTVLNEVGFTTLYKLSVNLSNLTSESITVNKDNTYEPFYLKFKANDIKLRTNTTILSGESFKLTPNSKLEYTLEYTIPRMTYTDIKSHVVQNVNYIKNNTTKDVEFSIK